MADMSSINEMIQCAIQWNCLDQNENITSAECKTKKPFEIILHVGQVTGLQS